MEGIHDVYLHQGTMNGDNFVGFLENCLLPILQPFNWLNPRSIVILDNASIHHIERVKDLVETQAGSKLLYLPPYSPDLNPAEGVISQIKSIMKNNDDLFHVYSAPRALIAMAFGMISTEDCVGHISNSGYNYLIAITSYLFKFFSFFNTSMIYCLSAVYSSSSSNPDCFKSANCL